MRADTPPQADRDHVPGEGIRGAIESILAGLTATLLGVSILWAAKNGYKKIFDFWMPHHVRYDRTDSHGREGARPSWEVDGLRLRLT